MSTVSTIAHDHALDAPRMWVRPQHVPASHIAFDASSLSLLVDCTRRCRTCTLVTNTAASPSASPYRSMSDTSVHPQPSPVPSSSPSPSPLPSSFPSPPRRYRWSTSPTLQLSLTSSYAPHWTQREGVRELIQNFYDGCQQQVQHLNQHLPPATSASSPFTLSIHNPPPSPSSPSPSPSSSSPLVYRAFAIRPSSPPIPLGHLTFSPSTSSLTLLNLRTTLTRKVLLIGYSTKRGMDAMVGSFGEGLKVGLLALLRGGGDGGVWMQTGGEVWRFGLYDDAGYGERLLGVWTEDEEGGVEVEGEEVGEAVLRSAINPLNRADTTTVVTGVSAAEWADWVLDFLFLSPPPPQSHVRVGQGGLLLSEPHRHALYVKGFKVSVLLPSELTYGVDLNKVQLDRDRKAVLQPADLHRQVGAMWVEAVSKRPDLLPLYFDLLQNASTSAEARNAEYYLTNNLLEDIATTFIAQHGPLSQPVLQGSAEDVLFISNQLQRRPVLVPAGLYDLLTRSARIESVQALMARHEAAVRPSIALTSLTPSQLHCLQSAVKVVQLVAPLFSVDDVAVTRFSDDSVWVKEEEGEGEGAAGGGVGRGEGGLRKVTLDSRVFDLEAVHDKWGDCGVEERRVAQGKGRGLKGWVGMSDCSCREVAIASLIIKQSRRVRWRRAAAPVQADRGRRGGDAIMAHLARSREAEQVLVNLVERLVRRGERDRQRRSDLEEEKQSILTHLAARPAPSPASPVVAAAAAVRERQGGVGEEEKEEREEELKGEREQVREAGEEVRRLQYEVEVARAEVEEWKLRVEREVEAAEERERVWGARVREMGGVGVEEVGEERLRELEELHVDGLKAVLRVREERRRKAKEEEEDRRKRGECGVCMAVAADTVLMPCRHSGVCYACAAKMQRCGVCRQKVEQRIQFFR